MPVPCSRVKAYVRILNRSGNPTAIQKIRPIRLGVILIGLALLLQCSLAGAHAASSTSHGKTVRVWRPIPGMHKIQHVIWIIQENHSFDNYFGTFPGVNGIPPGTCLPVRPGATQCISQFHMPQGQPLVDLGHNWASAHAAYDHGTMDGFVWAEGSPYTMGYYDERDIPNYCADHKPTCSPKNGVVAKYKILTFSMKAAF